MARGTAFSELQARVRAATGGSDNLSVGRDDLPMIKGKINTAYQTLYENHDWAHLKRNFARITLNAGQQWYDWPTGLNPERIITAVCWWDSKPHDLVRGIDFDDYMAYSSEDGDRSEPAMKWDLKWNADQSKDQLEVWPLPSTNTQQVQFIGFLAAPRLVNDADPCLLDDTLVELFASAAVLGEKEGKLLLSQGQEHLRVLKAHGKGGEQVHQMGLGSPRDDKPNFVLRIGHTN